jgi:hypothetical protein
MDEETQEGQRHDKGGTGYKDWIQAGEEKHM